MGLNTPLEGAIDTLYRDIRGLVTTAAGILCDSPSAAAQFAWVRPDGQPAMSAEVNSDWHRVKNMPAGLLWSRYATPGALRLAPGELERITLDRLDADAAELKRHLPGLPSWPPAAQAATCSMAWAMGPGFPANWPHWTASAKALDWKACAANCEIRWSDNTGVRPRDWVQAALFLEAAGVDPDQARQGWPEGPARDAALRALAAWDAAGEDFDSRATLKTGEAPG
jgi:hypothetical protein